MVCAHFDKYGPLADKLSEFRWAYACHGVPMWDKMLDRGLWQHPLLEGCGAAAVHIPVGPWAQCGFDYSPSEME